MALLCDQITRYTDSWERIKENEIAEYMVGE
jgi:hypothetical protein